jgi:hypothetical protein
MVDFACVVIHQPLPSGWDDLYNEPKSTIRTSVVTPEEFRALRDAPGKMIEADIEFQPMADASEIWEFRVYRARVRFLRSHLPTFGRRHGYRFGVVREEAPAH